MKNLYILTNTTPVTVINKFGFFLYIEKVMYVVHIIGHIHHFF
jgi:hypothetical protein